MDHSGATQIVCSNNNEEAPRDRRSFQTKKFLSKQYIWLQIRTVVDTAPIETYPRSPRSQTFQKGQKSSPATYAS
ncbi:hypothetical protein K440DRAFT_404958 [Wilcoxina mikolae CBS 423.85]|nr:hypothetical protein K440DRAFT_404958 [Wilcoxina mikolae CBS 423.85]